MKKIKVGILGATGMVGQNYLCLLQNHPWFEVIDLGASNRSSGKLYQEAVKDKWLMNSEIPEIFKDNIVRDVYDFNSIPKNIQLFFSALDLDDKEKTRKFEFEYAEKGYPVISNSSANRWTNDVPMIIPEINSQHSEIIPIQKKNRNLPKSGFVAVKPNCSIQSYLIGIHALNEAGFEVKDVQVTTLQALSGAGAKGITNSVWRENVIPYIGGEEEKTEREPLKILGAIIGDEIKNYNDLKISATCIRVPVIDGHSAVVHINFKEAMPSIEEIKNIWTNYSSEIDELKLPSAPHPAIIFDSVSDRPQVKADVNNGKGMAVTFGRLQKDVFFDYKFIGLSHNTIRGAAGGAILMAELLTQKGFIKHG
jgi:aspartate-semialdehyde dehydrogenase